MPVPVMTQEQREAGLIKARETVAARSAALGKVRDGTLTIPAVLATENEALLRARVRSVLLAVPRIGASTADKLLAECGIDPKRRVGGLGPRQREALAAKFAA